MWRRRPVVAGSFYPSHPKVLMKEVDRYLLDSDKKKLDGEIIGIISPHAGYIYSAPVAAYSYNLLKDSDVEISIVLAPSHRARFEGASVIPSGIYETPIGDVNIDKIIGEKLLKKSHFSFFQEAHNSEHSLEVQVPFLQRVLCDFRIVPIIIGVVDITTCTAIADEIYKILTNETRSFVIVISTDLSHYYTYEQANILDGIFIESFKKLDEDNIYNILRTNKAEACGQGAILTGISLCKKLGAKKIEILKYANSGDTAGGKDQVVGYLSAAILK